MTRRTPPVARLVSIGDELVRGLVIDANGPRIAARLARLGYRVAALSVVGDDVAEGADVLAREAAAADVVVATGGLGPTHDDRTRSMVATACGVELCRDEATVARIRAWLDARGIPERSGHLDQADVPEGATVFPNPAGTAPGFAVERGRCRVYVLPGVPAEAEALWRESVEADISDRAARLGARSLASRPLRMFGVPESTLSGAVSGMAAGRGLRLGVTADRSVVSLHLSALEADAEPESEEEIARRLDEVERGVRDAFPEAVFGTGEDDLAPVVVALLLERGWTVATAESCTGGLLAGLLTEVPGVSAVFLEGAVTYSNEAKVRTLGVSVDDLELHGAVSEVVARAMAEGIAKRAGADAGIGITGVAGPGGGTAEKPVGLVWIGVTLRGRTVVERLRGPGTRDQIRWRAALHALDRLRRLIREGRAL